MSIIRRTAGFIKNHVLGGENILVIVVNPFRKFGGSEEWMEKIEGGTVENSRSSFVSFFL